MLGYIIGSISISDPDRYGEYMRLTPAVIAKFGGRFIVRGGRKINLEGSAQSSRIVILEFETLELARSFFESEEYQQLKKLRSGAAEASFVLVEGCP